MEISHETLDNSKESSLEERMSYLDNLIKSFVEIIGAKSHKFDIHHTMLFGTMFPQRFIIEVEFEDGQKYGQSSNTFKDCFDKMVENVCYGQGKLNPYKEYDTTDIADNWMRKYPNEKPTNNGEYLVQRKGYKLYKEVWNGIEWSHNNNEITHWILYLKPID